MIEDLKNSIDELNKNLAYIHRQLQKAKDIGMESNVSVELNYALELEKRRVQKLRDEYNDTIQAVRAINVGVKFLEKHLNYNPSNDTVRDMKLKIQYIRSLILGLGV